MSQGMQSARVANLPPQTTSFVGRSEEIAAVSALLNDTSCRLLTLTGPGGIGKTRLAIEVVGSNLSAFPDGVVFVPLQPVRDPDNVVSAVAEAVGLRFHEGAWPRHQLINFMRAKRMLLLLDNFEHLLDVASLLTELLEAGVGNKILITSRESLNLPAEWLYQVEGLRFPGDEDDNVESFSAARLFAERARQARYDFSLEKEASCVRRICRLVEGAPLGIELAAGWLKHLPCRQVAEEIERKIDFLATTMRGVPERHRSMRAVFDSSWQLLNEDERRAFMNLSVFRGGFSREAAEQVAGASLVGLSALIDKSMLRLSSSGRYGMHERLRQFAEEKLAESNSGVEPIRDRHCNYFAAFLQQRLAGLEGEQMALTLREIVVEIDNVRAAWASAVEGRKSEQIRTAALCLWEFYVSRNWFQEGERAFDQAVAVLEGGQGSRDEAIALGVSLAAQGDLLHHLGQTKVAETLLTRSTAILRSQNARRELSTALSALVRLIFMAGRFQEAQTLNRESLDLASDVGNRVGVAYSTHTFSMIERIHGNYGESMRLKQEALAHFRDSGHRFGLGLALGDLGEVATTLGEYHQARQYMEEGLDILLEVGDRWHVGHQYEYLGHLDHAQGNYARAREHLDRSLDLAKEHGDPRRVTFSLVSLGDLFLALGRLEEAKRHFQEALELSREAKQPWQEAWSLRGLGQVANRESDYDRAGEFLKVGLSLSREIGWQFGEARCQNELGLVAIRTGEINNAFSTFHLALELALELELKPLTLEVLAGSASLLARQGEQEMAVELWTLAISHPAAHADTKGLARQRLTSVEPDLPAQLYDAARRRGEASDLGEAAAAVLERLAAGPAPSSPQGVLVEPLTEREQEVLRLLALGRSNRQIAADLVIAVGTVKTHVHNICGKLGAPNRHAAVARAGELGLL